MKQNCEGVYLVLCWDTFSFCFGFFVCLFFIVILLLVFFKLNLKAQKMLKLFEVFAGSLGIFPPCLLTCGHGHENKPLQSTG